MNKKHNNSAQKVMSWRAGLLIEYDINQFLLEVEMSLHVRPMVGFVGCLVSHNCLKGRKVTIPCSTCLDLFPGAGGRRKDLDVVNIIL